MYKKGFTLVELLIVVGLIGILIAITVTSYGTIQKKSRNSRRMNDLKAVQNALEQYASDNNGQYPTTTYDQLDVKYIPGTTKPSDPKTSCLYKQTNPTTSTYTICADLEGIGTFDCSATCNGTAGDGCLDDDYCISNLQ
jgi:prepilin-type N-terminal cleavage/methylation domain-containing protein